MTKNMKPQNFEEKIVWYSIISTYGLYLLGAQYILVSAIAWGLPLYLLKKLWDQTEDTPDEERVAIPVTVWVWLVGILALWVVMVIAQLDYSLGVEQIISSSNSFSKTAALLALIPLVGCLRIRPQLVYRAVCITCLQSLVFIAVISLMRVLHIPTISYVSPLHVLGHGGTDYYSVSIGAGSPDPLALAADNEFRLQLFTPWAPALGLVGNIYFFLARQEAHRTWRWIGIIGAIAMIWVSVSRAALLCLPGVMLITWFATAFTRPALQICSGILCFFSGIFASVLIDWLKDFQEKFNNARASSSRVRNHLREIEVYRWWKEARIWGHGVSQVPGPKTVEGMPIGSHDTWFTFLYINGIVGVIAVAVPMAWSLIDLLIKAQKSRTARVGLSILLVLLVFSFSEGLDLLAYTYWPGLLMMGIAFKEEVPTLVTTDKNHVMI